MPEIKLLFWLAGALVLYTYAGYPLVLACGARRSRKHRQPARRTGAVPPAVTLLIPACNEERWIARKIENTLALDYPGDRLEIIVASDGSTDRTAEIAAGYQHKNITTVHFAERLGKQEMLNRLVPRATGSVVVMTDTNAMLASDALAELVQPFADPGVGCAIGRRVCVLQQRSVASRAESFYWRYESWIKQAESDWHSCLAATGQLYAVARDVFPHVERVGEDFYIPMKVLASTGRRIVYVSAAVAAIPAAASLGVEFERKTRAHVAFLISLPMLWELLVPGRTPVWWQFISHHVLRMFVPGALLAVLVASATASATPLYFDATVLQMIFYACALVGAVCAAMGRRPKPFYFPFYFVFVQLALVQSWLRWPRGKFDYAWQRTERLTDSN